MLNRISKSKHLCRAVLAVGIVLGSQIAASVSYAVPVTYSFTTAAAPYGFPTTLSSTFAGLSASGTFTYDSEAALLSASPIRSVYSGFSNLSGSVGGYSFGDESGYVSVENDSYMPPPAGAASDLLVLNSEPAFGGSGNYDLTGFSASGYTLVNVRLFWIETVIAGTADFLDGGALLSDLPQFVGRLALDFVPSPYTPVDGQPSPTSLSFVFFDNLTVTKQVPEPATWMLLAFGLLPIGAMSGRKPTLAR